MQKVKVSELPSGGSLEGLYTLGVNSENESVKVSLEFVQTSVEEAVAKAEKAAENADDAAGTAKDAASSADSAAANANSAADGANSAAGEAQEAAAAAIAAAENANAAADASVNVEEISEEEIDALLEQFDFLDSDGAVTEVEAEGDGDLLTLSATREDSRVTVTGGVDIGEMDAGDVAELFQ